MMPFSLSLLLLYQFNVYDRMIFCTLLSINVCTKFNFSLIFLTFDVLLTQTLFINYYHNVLICIKTRSVCTNLYFYLSFLFILVLFTETTRHMKLYVNDICLNEYFSLVGFTGNL